MLLARDRSRVSISFLLSLTAAMGCGESQAPTTAASVAPRSGDLQCAAPGTAVPVPPAVVVTDAAGNGVPGFPVSFGVTSGGGSVTGASTQTGPDGVARVGNWTLGSGEPNLLQAFANGLAGNPVTFRAQRPDTWVDVVDLPTSPALGTVSVMASATVAGRLYASVLGHPNVQPALFAFDPDRNAWDQKAPPLHGVPVAATALDGKLYMLGAGSLSSYDAPLDVYDPATDSWTTKARLPRARSGVGFAAVNGLLYVVGGVKDTVIGEQSPTTTVVPDVAAYDPASDSWSMKAPLPLPLRSPAAVGLGGQLWVIGGGTGSGVNAQILRYDPGNNGWLGKASMPVGQDVRFVAARSGRIYAVWVSTSNPQGPLGIEVYDVAADQWSAFTTIPAERELRSLDTLSGAWYATYFPPGSGGTGRVTLERFCLPEGA